MYISLCHSRVLAVFISGNFIYGVPVLLVFFTMCYIQGGFSIFPNIGGVVCCQQDKQ
jgi:hypothetical protein